MIYHCWRFCIGFDAGNPFGRLWGWLIGRVTVTLRRLGRFSLFLLDNLASSWADLEQSDQTLVPGYGEMGKATVENNALPYTNSKGSGSGRQPCMVASSTSNCHHSPSNLKSHRAAIGTFERWDEWHKNRAGLYRNQTIYIGWSSPSNIDFTLSF